MRDRDRSARGDLPAEDRDDRAGGAEHVAETDGHEARATAQAGLQGTEHELGETLARAHDVGRVDGLVRGDEDELLRAVLGGEVRDDPGPGDVILQGFAGLGLHHRHVLMRGGVEHEAGPMRGEDLGHPGEVRDVADDGRDEGAVARGDELLLGLVEEHFALVEQQEAGGAVGRDLTAELEADAAAGAGDEHDASFDHRGDGAVVELHGRPPEDVFDGDRPDVGSPDAPTGELGHRRDHEHAEITGGGERADFADAADALGRQREDDFGHAVFLGEFAHARRRTDDGDAVDMQVVLGDVVVEEADRLEAVTSSAEKVGDELRAGLAGADHGDTLDHPGRRGRADGEPFTQRAHRDAEADEQDQGEVEVDQRDATRQTESISRGAAPHEHRQSKRGEGRGGEGERRAERVRKTEVIEDAAELPPEGEQKDLERDQPEQRDRALLIKIGFEGQMLRSRRLVSADETEFIGEPQRQRGQHPVGREEERGAGQAGGRGGHGVGR